MRKLCCHHDITQSVVSIRILQECCHHDITQRVWWPWENSESVVTMGILVTTRISTEYCHHDITQRVWSPWEYSESFVTRKNSEFLHHENNQSLVRVLSPWENSNSVITMRLLRVLSLSRDEIFFNNTKITFLLKFFIFLTASLCPIRLSHYIIS